MTVLHKPNFIIFIIFCLFWVLKRRGNLIPLTSDGTLGSGQNLLTRGSTRPEPGQTAAGTDPTRTEILVSLPSRTAGRSKGVPLDLPVPSFYMDWDKITVPESIWVKVGKRLKEERLANARNAQERSQAERLGELRSDQFEYWM